MRVEIYGDAATNTVSGDTVQFTADDAIPVKSLEAQITPSIAGNQSVTITANGQTTEVSLEKTVYGGGVNVTTGLVTETHGGGAYDPSAVPADLASKIRSATTERSASGEVAAFSCTLGEFPMSAVSTTLTPTQDMNGYDRPWPGGGGVNLWNPASTTPGYYTSNGEFRGPSGNAEVTSDFIPITETIVAAGFFGYASGEQKWGGAAFFDSNKNFISRNAGTISDPWSTRRMQVPEGAAYFRAMTRTYGHDQGLLFACNGDIATYSPYENICPITGHDSVRVWVQPTHDTTADPAATVQLGQTVYGGTIDVVSGVLTVTMAMVDLGTLTWAATSYDNPNGSVFTSSAPCPFAGWRIAHASAISNVMMPATASGAWISEASNTFWWNDAATGWRAVWGKAHNGSSLAEFTSMLASTNAVVVALLAKPLTIQLTPTQVSTILGQNRVWSDGGGETSVTYRDGFLSNVSGIMTNSTALTTGENITYTLSQQRTYQIPGTVIRTVDGNNVMSANTGKITVTWSSPWFDITPWIAYQGLTFSRNDVDAPDAGRDMSGYMHRGRVGVKEKMNITTVQLTRAQSSILQTLLYPETIQVRVTPYPRTNAAHTMSMYTNNVKTTYVIHRANGEDLQSLTFPLIEN